MQPSHLQAAYNKDGERFLVGLVDIKKSNGSKREEILTRIKEEIFYSEDGETLEEVVQSGGRYHILGSV